eukprot:PhF_6_TR41597/c0_g1_i1/m.63036
MSFDIGFTVVNSILCVLYIILLIFTSVKMLPIHGRSDDCRYKFLMSVCIHCPTRSIVLILTIIFTSLESSNDYATNVAQTVVTAIPSITFQSALYLYLRMWQIMCENIDALSQAPPVPRRSVVLWFSGWIITCGMDIIFYETNVNKEGLCILMYTIVNYVFIACGFAYLGGRVTDTMDTSNYGTMTNEVYAHHVRNVRLFFGTACLAHSICGILQMWLTTSPVFANQYFGTVYYFIIEFLPLAASLMSMAWVQMQTLNS